MSELQQSESDRPSFSTQRLVPRIERFGEREIEMTYLGENTYGRATWILWNAEHPYLIGMLIRGKLGYTFEQRTSEGVMLHENVSLARVQRTLAS